MNMTIEEKIDNFRALLRHSYQAQKSENLKISYEILERSGFTLSELSDVICPSLLAEGVLRHNFSALATIEEQFVFEKGALEKIQDIENRKKAIAKTKTTDNIQKEINFDAIRRLDDGAKSYVKQITSYEFVVNKNRLGKTRSIKKVPFEPLWNLPSGTRWEDISLKFQDAEKVEILIKNRHFAYSDFKAMRFGRNKPDKRWKLLYLLAVIYTTNKQIKGNHNVSASVEDLAHALHERTDQKAKMNVHTTKKSLSSQLGQIFGMGYEDPFEDYNQWGYYKSKFKLEPEPDLRRENVYEVGGKLNENRSYAFDDESGNFDEEDNLS